MKKFQNMISVFSLALLMTVASCSDSGSEPGPDGPPAEVNLSEQNLLRAMEITDKAVEAHFTGDGMAMARYYNPYTKIRSQEKGSVWMYTSAIEAVNAILHALKTQQEHGNAALYNEHFNKYSDLLQRLYDNADYYLGTFELTSYTQTKQWTVYGVNRGGSKGGAQVAGIENVYDDQMWLTRELLESYKITGNNAYLQKAEYLTEYVLDGWDCTRDANGEERGGITWGPGYVTKHSCSNGPIVSPLVWLHELYKDKGDEVTHRYIDLTDKQTRLTAQVKKSDYYLDFAKKIYAWQKNQLLRGDGVYDDMRGGCSPGQPQTETVNGTAYRIGTNCQDRVGPAISYNSGSMLSGGADLYRVTGDNLYLEDSRNLSDASFQYFAKLGRNKADYYTYDISGFNNWFNGVLMRGYVDVYPAYGKASDYISSFQKNLDYAYDNFLYEGFLPTNLLVGWNRDKGKNNAEGMFSFAFAAEYAVLSRYELQK
ncbi:glycoside hydrolase family 76 protein [Chryseosolibacter indicus]|uniref:Hydrolase n=1 Tax=Chryseosolibacter indicus TaxID=2782351 RepID=A0ABS5VXN8_9BACT|nr:glycoside hydrolase family 76 protein [Chryseosolibacter indicus]MBT1705622.1 hydrolase [Chryseosolibacter indicus]